MLIFSPPAPIFCVFLPTEQMTFSMQDVLPCLYRCGQSKRCHIRYTGSVRCSGRVLWVFCVPDYAPRHLRLFCLPLRPVCFVHFRWQRKASPLLFQHVLLLFYIPFEIRSFLAWLYASWFAALLKQTALHSGYADSFFRCFSLLRRKTFCPLAVAILLRNPCFFFLLRTLGWNVIFMNLFLLHPCIWNIFYFLLSHFIILFKHLSVKNYISFQNSLSSIELYPPFLFFIALYLCFLVLFFIKIHCFYPQFFCFWDYFCFFVDNFLFLCYDWLHRERYPQLCYPLIHTLWITCVKFCFSFFLHVGFFPPPLWRCCRVICKLFFYTTHTQIIHWQCTCE